ncbi:SAVMC3_10250 family protein [Salinispora fenicalii]|uniref:SAVMC3_10250 family protein n=1 Tax=Salinispora fenicalii TaxID=1137263 RepID=UPI0021E02276|nr:SAVMC3_10250 family protein [Salinispora fenicalii]
MSERCGVTLSGWRSGWGATRRGTPSPVWSRAAGSGSSFVTQAGHVVSALAPDSPEATSGPLSRNGVRDLLAALDAQRPTVSTAARVTGLARVSALLPAAGGDVDCLVASPLIVEYVN